jgi:hypothetical protein
VAIVDASQLHDGQLDAILIRMATAAPTR